MRIGSFPYRPGDNPYQRLFTEAVEAAGASVVRIPPRKLLPIHWALSHGIDLLHLDWPHDFYLGRNRLMTFIKRQMFLSGCRRLRKVPVVWTMHNVIGHDSAMPEYELRMVQHLVDRCDAIIALSNAAAGVIRQTYRVDGKTRIVVLSHGHYIDAYPNTTDLIAARDRLGISRDKKVILYFGRIRPYKGVEDLIEAFGRIDHANAFLVIAGKSSSPGLEARLQNLSSAQPNARQIRLELSSVPRNELQYYFSACDLVALPFRNVLNSGSLLLALSFGRGVVAPNVGSIVEVAPEGSHFGYKAGDVEGLAATLASALDLPDLALRGERAREHVEQQFGWQQIGEQACKLYTDLLTSHQSGQA